MPDIVAVAAGAVDHEHWVTRTGGDVVPQSSNPEIIHRMLRLLEIRPGMTVLEIGTGSGYSGALLAAAVGDSGRVVSLDVVPELVERAAVLHRQAGHRHVGVHLVDGFAGYPDDAPYDRIIAWTTPEVLPDPWLHQLADTGLLVTPVTIAEVATAHAILRCGVGADHRPGPASLHPGSFIEMTPDVISDFAVPIRYVDAVLRHADGPPSWISAVSLHNRPTDAADLAAQLVAATPGPGFLDGRPRDLLAAYLFAATGTPASAGNRHGRGIGVATPDSAAIILHGGALLAAGKADARDELAAIITSWINAGQPGYHAATVHYTPDEAGWKVRTRFSINA